VSVRKRNPQDRPDWSPGVIVVEQFVPILGPRDWAAEKALDKDFSMNVVVPTGGTYYELYTVPDGKLLLIAEWHVSTRFAGYLRLLARFNWTRRALADLTVEVGSVIAMVFTKPKRVNPDEVLEVYAYNEAAEARGAWSLGGWEIEFE